MSKRFDLIAGLTAACGMLVLILDSKTALAGAQEGIELCVRTLIPSLFPFLFLSGFLSSTMAGRQIPFLRFVGKMCRIPQGAEYILITGLLGGYPVGAITISEAHRVGSLSEQDARRMLAFCNNCGPAFVFGVTVTLFQPIWCPLVLMGIHIASAICVGMIVPGNPGPYTPRKRSAVSPVQTFNQAIRSMVGICGWVILFKTLIVFIQRWIGWYFPQELQITIGGILELSNGCVGLKQIDDDALRFILCAGFLGFGGICVTMQTMHATGKIRKDLYFPGKVLQSSISVSLASMLFGKAYWGMPAVIAVCFIIFLRKKQKTCRNLQLIDV